MQAAAHDQREQMLLCGGSKYVVKRKTQNSTAYYYNHSDAREQEEFLLEYKFFAGQGRGLSGCGKFNDVLLLFCDHLPCVTCCKT